MTMPGIGIPQEPALRLSPTWVGVKVPAGEGLGHASALAQVAPADRSEPLRHFKGQRCAARAAEL